MELSLNQLSIKIADKLNEYVPKEGLEYKKVALGAEVFLINITKSLIIFPLSMVMGVFIETLMTMFGYVILRRFAFGLHALTNTKCTITSVCMFVLIPFFVKGYSINIYVMLMLYVFVFTSMFLYAPSDTEFRPILGAKKRAKLRKNTMISFFVLLALVLIVPNNEFKLMATIGAVFESISILPITYNILKRRRNNYEQFESGFNNG